MSPCVEGPEVNKARFSTEGSITPSPTAIRAALRSGYDSLQCHLKIMRDMAGREIYPGGCFSRQSFECEAERTETDLGILGLMLQTVESDTELAHQMQNAFVRWTRTNPE